MLEKLSSATWRTQLAVAFSLMSVIPLLTFGYLVVVYFVPGEATPENLVLAFLLNILLALCGLWVIGRIIGSISKLGVRINEIAEGDLKGKVSGFGNPEFDELVRSVSSIVDRLREDRNRLRKFNQQLEVSVEEKTTELVKANQALRQELEERGKIERSLIRSRDELRELALRLDRAREDERSRIERDIHDELGQNLTALKMDLSWLQNNMKADGDMVRERIKTMLRLVQGTVETVRRICAELRPVELDKLGLTAAVEAQVGRFGKRTGCACDLSVPEEAEVGEEEGLVLFRCLQEALTNIAKHADASRVSICLAVADGYAELTVEDDGRGADAGCGDNGESALGLIGLRERARALNGDFNVRSRRNQGTVVCMKLPVVKGG
jgi:signal transduction histidine kinase